MTVEIYQHHDREVAVQQHLKGKHREHCLCYGCDRFKPDRDDNCCYASTVFSLCKQSGLVLPVWECPDFRANNETLVAWWTAESLEVKP